MKFVYYAKKILKMSFQNFLIILRNNLFVFNVEIKKLRVKLDLKVLIAVII